MELDNHDRRQGHQRPRSGGDLCSNSADAIDWLDEHGITLHSVSSFGGASVKRIHRPVDAEGKTVSVGSYMIPLLQENCDKAGVQTLLEHHRYRAADRCKRCRCGCEGYRYRRPDHHCECQGCGADHWRLRRKIGDGHRVQARAEGLYDQPTPQAHRVRALRWLPLGADTVDMDQIEDPTPPWRVTPAALITEGLRGDGAVLDQCRGQARHR